MSEIHLIPMNETVEQTYERGYTQALADAVAAVTAYWNEAYPGGVLELAKFIAAIESLEVKP